MHVCGKISNLIRERPLMTSHVFWLFLTYLPTYVPRCEETKEIEDRQSRVVKTLMLSSNFQWMTDVLEYHKH